MQGATERVVELFQIAFNNLTFRGLCERIEAEVRAHGRTYIVTANVDHVCRYHSDPAFAEAYRNAAIVVCDGTPLLWISRLLGRPIREKLSGSDLLVALSGFAAERGLTIFLCGAQEGVAATAADRLRAKFPALKVAGVLSPPFGFYREEEQSAEVVRQIREASPDICFLALGSPQQEIWMQRYSEPSGVPVMLGVGASFDFVAGRVKRAPVWMQHAGLEWLWRLYQEPRRLWHRYLVEDMQILRLIWREIRSRRRYPAQIS